MQTTLYYFSGTGNSLAIAKKLTAKIGACELIPIAAVWQQDDIIVKTEKVGFVFPLYYVGLPKIVLEFIKKLEFKKTD